MLGNEATEWNSDLIYTDIIKEDCRPFGLWGDPCVWVRPMGAKTDISKKITDTGVKLLYG